MVKYFCFVKKKWDTGDHAAPLAYLYFTLRKSYNLSNETLLEAMLKDLPQDSVNTPLTQKIVFQNATALEGRAFDYLLARKSQPRYMSALTRIINQHKQIAIKEPQEKKLDAVIKAIQAISETPEMAQLNTTQLRMKYALEAQQPDQFHNLATEYIPDILLPLLLTTQDATQRQPFELAFETMLWQYTKYVSNKSHLRDALSWLNQYPAYTQSEMLLQYQTQLTDLTR
jgi:hypothetical protein